jgi:hypothetical protein
MLSNLNNSGNKKKKMKRDACMQKGTYLATTENIFLRGWIEDFLQQQFNPTKEESINK